MKGFYKAIAVVFHPLFMPVYGALIVLYKISYLSFSILPQVKKFLLVLLLVNIIAPAISLGTMYRRKIISDLEITNRKERRGPFILLMCYYLVSYGLLRYRSSDLLLPNEIYSMFLGVAVSLFISTLISLKYKISIHMLGISGILGLIVALSHKYSFDELFWISVLALIAGLVGTSRMYTKNHTFSEILMGTAIGFFINYLIVYYEVIIF